MKEEIAERIERTDAIFWTGCFFGILFGAAPFHYALFQGSVVHRGLLEQELHKTQIETVGTRDVNGDAREDIVVRTVGGETSVYLQQLNGRYVSLETYVSARKDSADDYRNSILDRADGGVEK